MFSTMGMHYLYNKQVIEVKYKTVSLVNHSPNASMIPGPLVIYSGQQRDLLNSEENASLENPSHLVSNLFWSWTCLAASLWSTEDLVLCLEMTVCLNGNTSGEGRPDSHTESNISLWSKKTKLTKILI